MLSKEAGEKETHLVLCDPTERNYDTCDKFSVVVYQTSQVSNISYFLSNNLKFHFFRARLTTKKMTSSLQLESSESLEAQIR